MRVLSNKLLNNWLECCYAELFYFLYFRFTLELKENNQDKLRASVVLNDRLDYNDQMIYHMILAATVNLYAPNAIFYLI